MIYSLHDEPVLDGPVMVSALAGWVDAAAVGTSAIAHLADDAKPVATFDPDVLFDYRSQRPVLDIVDGVMTRAVWPEVVVRHSSIGGRDLLLLMGLEPDLAWNSFASGVGDIAESFGVSQLITLGSVPGAVPHTLPPPVMTTASDPELLKDERRPAEGLLRVPAACVSMVDMHVSQRGVPTVGFFVQVPHYVTAPYPSGVLALLQRFARHLDLEMSLGSFEEEARVHREQLDEVVAGQPEAQEHVRRLEAMNAEQQMISGEEIASEIERYLRESGGRDGDDRA